jgi:hypothetical protein
MSKTKIKNQKSISGSSDANRPLICSPSGPTTTSNHLLDHQLDHAIDQSVIWVIDIDYEADNADNGS